MLSSPIFLAFVAPPNTCGTPTCPVPHCAKCGGAQVNVVNKQTDPSLATTDVVTEHQHYTCSSGFTPGATSVSNCAHCVVR